MKAKRRAICGIIISVSVLVLSSCKTIQAPSLPEGAVALADIISTCAGDACGDGNDVLLAISGDGITLEEERYGQMLLVCDVTAGVDLSTLAYIPADKIIYSIDLTDLKPMKVQLGDINGDGINEISVCVYKTAKFHDVMAKRPFFFDLADGNLIPIWLGSRLSRPFDDYILQDMNGDTYDEIVSIEQLENGERILAVYIWKGFGFEVLAESDPFPCTVAFTVYDNAATSINVIRSDTGAKLEYILKEGELNHVA